MTNSKPEKPNVFITTGINRPLLIEASAGTGKTYALMHIILRIIVESEEEVPLERILVVTFTNNATYELKSRLRSRLKEVFRILSYSKINNPKIIQYLVEDQKVELLGDPEFLQEGELKRILSDKTLAAQIGIWIKDTNKSGISESRMQQALRRIKSAIDNIDNASVFTIHSFCQKMLQRCAFSTTMPFDFDVLEENTLSTKAIDEIVRARVSRIRAEANKKANSFDNKEAGEAAEKITNETIKYFLENGFFSDYLRYLSEEKKNRVLKNIQFKFAPTPPAGSEDGLIEALENFLEETPSLLQKLKEKNRVVTYDDILLQMKKNLDLQQSGFVKKVRDSYDAVLIDEFQDTDSIQYSIFRKIFLDEDTKKKDRPVIFVGDPKQSIYKFRGAELDCYLDAKKDIEKINKDGIIELTQNFRSTPGLVIAANKFFSTKSFKKDGLNYSEIGFNSARFPLFEKKSETEFLPVPPFELWLEKDGEFNKSVNELRRLEDWLVAEDIAKKLIPNRFYLGSPEKKLRKRDIAVLVRTRYDAEGLIKELAKRNIYCSFDIDEDVLATEEATEILYILQAIEDPKSRKAVNAARSTIFFGEKLGDIELNEAAGIEAKRLLDQVGKTFTSKGIIAAFSELFTKYKVEKRLLKHSSGSRQLTNYRHILELLHKQNRSIKTISGLIRWLQRQRQKKSDSEERNIRRESDDDLVRIVTIHKSKGLEYPVVYLLRASGELKADKSAIIERQNTDDELIETGERTAHYQCKVGDKKSKSSLDVEKVLEEEVRIAYVAFTRASARLVIPLFYRTSSRGFIWGSKISPYARILLPYEVDDSRHNGNVKHKSTKPRKKQTKKYELSEEYKSQLRTELFTNFEKKLEEAKKDVIEALQKGIEEAQKQKIENNPFVDKNFNTNNYVAGVVKKEFSIEDINSPLTQLHEETSEELEFFKPVEQERRNDVWHQTSFSGLASNISWSRKSPVFDEGDEGDVGDGVEGDNKDQESKLDLNSKPKDNSSESGSPIRDKNNDWDYLRYKPSVINAADYGIFLHKLIERIGQKSFSLDHKSIRQVVEEELIKSSIEKTTEKGEPQTSQEVGDVKEDKGSVAKPGTEPNKLKDHASALTEMLENVLQVPMFKNIIDDPKFKDVQGLNRLSEFKLCNLNSKEKIHEMDFLIGVGRSGIAKKLFAYQLGEMLAKFGYKGLDLAETDITGYLTGQIDLAFHAGGKFWIIDWKSNWISSNQEDYQRKNLGTFMTKKHYTLQYLLYIIALKRFLETRFGVKNGYEKIGGIAYFFLRGINQNIPSQGIFFDRPNEQFIEQLDKVLREGFIDKDRLYAVGEEND